MRSHRLSVAAFVAGLVVAAIGAPAVAEDAHHPPGAATQAAPAPAQQSGQGMMGGQGGMMSGQGMMGGQGMPGGSGMMGQGMMGGQQGMMDHHRMMMGMMGGGGMMGMAMSGMTDRVEGRIAFLRAELKIAANQTEAWNRFADALRASAKKLSELRAAAPKAGDSPATLEQKLDRQVQMLAARTDGARAVSAGYAGLAKVLTDEQKKLAEELIPPHAGLMAGMMM